MQAQRGQTLDESSNELQADDLSSPKGFDEYKKSAGSKGVIAMLQHIMDQAKAGTLAPCLLRLLRPLGSRWNKVQQSGPCSLSTCALPTAFRGGREAGHQGREHCSVRLRGIGQRDCSQRRFKKQGGALGALGALGAVLETQRITRQAQTRHVESLQVAGLQASITKAQAGPKAFNKSCVMQAYESYEAHEDYEAYEACGQGEKADAKTDRKNILAAKEALVSAAGTLHSDCDFLIQNFQTRQTAIDDEVTALVEAKAVMQGITASDSS